jgi:hypothetical protein
MQRHQKFHVPPTLRGEEGVIQGLATTFDHVPRNVHYSALDLSPPALKAVLPLPTRYSIEDAVKAQVEESRPQRKHSGGKRDLFLMTEEELGETAWLIKGRFNLPLGEPSTLFGDSGIGKSATVYTLATAVATGRDFLESATTEGNVLFVDFEMDWKEAARRIHKAAKGLGITNLQSLHDRLIYLNYRGRSIYDKEVHAEILLHLEAYNIKLLIIDSWERAFLGNSIDGGEVNEANRFLSSLLNDNRSALVIDHVSTSSQNKRLAGGSRHKRHAARMQYHFEMVSEDKETGRSRLRLSLTKNNYEGVKPVEIDRVWTSDTITHSVHDPNSKGTITAPLDYKENLTKDMRAVIKALASQEEPMNESGIHERVAGKRGKPDSVRRRLSRNSVYPALQQLGLIAPTETPQGGKGNYYALTEKGKEYV